MVAPLTLADRLVALIEGGSRTKAGGRHRLLEDE
jgi:hypothetical protein